MTDSEKLVGLFARRLTAWSIVHQAVAAVTVWAFIWGTAVLVLRVALGLSTDWLLAGAVGVPLVLAFAAWQALRQRPSVAAVRAVLDRQGNCGGLLMAGAERDLGTWQRSMPTVELPRIHWRAGRPLGLLAVSIAYVLIAFLLPGQVAALANGTALDVSREAERLSEQVKVLKEEKIIEPERADALQKKLEQIKQQSAGTDPGKTLEALDHFNDMVRQVAKKAAEAAARQANSLNQIDIAAQALNAAAGSLEDEDTTELLEELTRLTRKAAAENEEFNEGLDGNLAEAVKNGKLNKDQLDKLARAARDGRKSAQARAKRLQESKLIDGDECKACNGKGKCDPNTLADFLKKHGSKPGLAEGMEELSGNGGVDEGGTSPGLQFGDPSDKEGTKFREETLPPSDVVSLKDSQVTGVSGATPKKDPKAGTPGSGSLKGAATGGGSANAGTVLPQHKGPVGRYFDRDKK